MSDVREAAQLHLFSLGGEPGTRSPRPVESTDRALPCPTPTPITPSPAQAGAPDPSPADPLLQFTSLPELATRVGQCQSCRLRAGCRQVVFGEGDPQADLLVVGEGPGATEDELGRPFVGAAGQLLDRMLAALGFTRPEVYIANVVKCRPPNNRVPLPDEVAACRPYLDRQIDLIHPKVILGLGSTALQALVGVQARITRDRGRWFRYHSVPLIATFHPAALLRDPHKKPLAWLDLQVMFSRYMELGGRRPSHPGAVTAHPGGQKGGDAGTVPIVSA